MTAPVRRLDIGFLPGAVFLLEGATREDVPRIKAALQEACEDPLEFRDGDFRLDQDADALCAFPDGTAHVAILTRPGLEGAARTRALVHECQHVTFTVLRHAGVKACAKSEEVYAYLLEHLVGQVLDLPERSQFANLERAAEADGWRALRAQEVG